MTLANKYLRYSPKITLEIFKLIWDKLIESGFKSRYNNKLYNEFECFKGKHNYFIIDDICFNTHMSLYIINGLETTVQEILGYDPFVNKEIIPEYVECMKVATRNTKIGEIFKCRHCNGSFEFEYNDKSGISYNSWDGWSCVWEDELPQKYFKPSTKEAFEQQNQPKSIEKWSVGSYFVIEKDGLYNISSSKRGDICLIKENENFNFINKKDTTNWSFDLREGSSWFATKSEAQEFAKTLVEPVKKEFKQPLKKAVHCKTQEEWDFVTEKLGYKWTTGSFDENSSWISLNSNQHSNENYWTKHGYQILSFQEWCDLNGYKMENEVKFEVGKWYKNLSKNSQKNTFGKFLNLRNNEKEFWMSEYIYKGKFTNTQGWLDYSSETVEINIEEIQQYLPNNHPDKIKVDREFKVGDFVISLDKSNNYIIDEFCIISKINKTHLACKNKPQNDWSMKPFRNFRHATPEEINQHLISIGQIPAEPICTNTNSSKHNGCGEKYGCIQNCDECNYYQIPVGEPLNTGIEPSKDGMFKYKQTMPGASWSGGTIDNHLDVMIPTTGNSYNKDFSTSIIPVKSISAAIEFNYLPEPK